MEGHIENSTLAHSKNEKEIAREGDRDRERIEQERQSGINGDDTMKSVKSMKNQMKNVKSDNWSVKCCKTNGNTKNFKIR